MYCTDKRRDCFGGGQETKYSDEQQFRRPPPAEEDGQATVDPDMAATVATVMMLTKGIRNEMNTFQKEIRNEMSTFRKEVYDLWSTVDQARDLAELRVALEQAGEEDSEVKQAKEVNDRGEPLAGLRACGAPSTVVTVQSDIDVDVSLQDLRSIVDSNRDEVRRLRESFAFLVHHHEPSQLPPQNNIDIDLLLQDLRGIGESTRAEVQRLRELPAQSNIALYLSLQDLRGIVESTRDEVHRLREMPPHSGPIYGDLQDLRSFVVSTRAEVQHLRELPPQVLEIREMKVFLNDLDKVLRDDMQRIGNNVNNICGRLLALENVWSNSHPSDSHTIQLFDDQLAHVEHEQFKLDAVARSSRHEQPPLDTAQPASSVEVEGLKPAESESMDLVATRKISILEDVITPLGDFLTLESEFAAVPIKASTWDAAILIGQPSIGCGGSLMLCLCLWITILLQVTIIYIMAENGYFYEGTIMMTLKDAQFWRWGSGHNIGYMDPITRQSLTRRVCDLDTSLPYSTYQRDVVDESNSYLRPWRIMEWLFPNSHILLFHGPVLTCAILTLWSFVILGDINQNFSFMAAVWCLPRGTSKLLRSEDRHSVTEINHAIVWHNSLVCIIRLGIAAGLAVIGLIWLSVTTSIGELILNGVALQFVFDIDEMVFATCCSYKVQHIVETAVPLKAGRRGISLKGFGLGRFLIMVLAFACASTAYCIYGLPKFYLLLDIRRELCGGNKDFVVGVHKGTGWAVSAETPKAQVQIDLYASAVKDISCTNGCAHSHSMHDSLVHSTKTDYGQRIFDVETWLGASNAETRRFEFMYTGCKDDGGIAKGQESFRWHTLRSVAQVSDAHTCADVSEHCDRKDAALVRMSCPATCGCRDPLSGLVWSSRAYGCPREECIDSTQYQNALANLTCKDASVNSLRTGRYSKAWARYWDRMISSLKVWTSYAHTKFSLDDLREEAHNAGCGVLANASRSFRQLCTDRTGYAALAAFCPETCRCDHGKYFTRYCPSSCLKHQ